MRAVEISRRFFKEKEGEREKEGAKFGQRLERSRVAELVEALRIVLNQPFNGSWDAQAVFVREALAKYEGEKESGK
jgi:hypothetical protein